MVKLGVNVDHVATVRQARREEFPDLLEAAKNAVQFGADGITAHLREDRRHIQDADIALLRKNLDVPLNLEMSIAPEIVEIAEKTLPAWVCLVPENRKELTTEGGLDVKGESSRIEQVVRRLKSKGIKVSLFIDPSDEAVQISQRIGADAVELHTGTFAKRFRTKDAGLAAETARLQAAARKAEQSGLLANAGHGIDYENVSILLKAHRWNELNIGFSIVARALFVGIGQAVKEMKTKMGAG